MPHPSYSPGKAGDLEGAEYLWSNRKYANSAMVVGRYVNVKSSYCWVFWLPRSYGLSFKQTILTAIWTLCPRSHSTDIVSKMQVRGRAALALQNQSTWFVLIFPKSSKYHYRRDYDIGDIVTVDGNFGEIAPMRVVEYVEIQDENEEKGHPTLETPNPIA